MPDASDGLSTDHLLRDLRPRSVRGGAITLGAQAFKLVLQFATIVVLARLLPPEDFGLIAMVGALCTMLDLVKELGLSAATIRKPDLTHAEVTALFWLNTSAGALIMLFLIAFAPLVARFYEEPQLTAITRWLGLGFFLGGLTVQHWALLRRQMRFSAAVAVDAGSEVIGFFVAIALARAGAGYWALVVQRLSASFCVLVGSWALCSWRPAAPRRLSGIGDLLRFGFSVTGVNVAAAFARSIDQILVGWLWGANALGLYERAAKLLLTPLNNINMPLYAVAMPSLSRIENQPERYRRAFCEVMEKLAMVVVPGALFVSSAADWIVRIIFGAQWLAATPLVAFFAIAAAYQPLIQAAGLLYLTQTRSRDMVRAAILDTSVCVLAVVGGLTFGVTAIAAALAATGILLRAPLAFWLATRRGPVRLSDIALSIFPALVAGLVVMSMTAALRATVFTRHTPAIDALAVAVILAVPTTLAVYAAIPRSRHALSSFLALAQHLRGPTPDL